MCKSFSIKAENWGVIIIPKFDCGKGIEITEEVFKYGCNMYERDSSSFFESRLNAIDRRGE